MALYVFINCNMTLYENVRVVLSITCSRGNMIPPHHMTPWQARIFAGSTGAGSYPCELSDLTLPEQAIEQSPGLDGDESPDEVEQEVAALASHVGVRQKDGTLFRCHVYGQEVVGSTKVTVHSGKTYWLDNDVGNALRKQPSSSKNTIVPESHSVALLLKQLPKRKERA